MKTNTLQNQAKIIYQDLFQMNCPESVLLDFIQAHGEYYSFIDQQQEQQIQQWVERGINLHDLEFFLRIARKPHLLSKKFSLMLYLGEADIKTSKLYLPKKSLFIGFPLIFWGIQSCISLVRGAWTYAYRC